MLQRAGRQPPQRRQASISGQDARQRLLRLADDLHVSIHQAVGQLQQRSGKRVLEDGTAVGGGSSCVGGSSIRGCSIASACCICICVHA